MSRTLCGICREELEPTDNCKCEDIVRCHECRGGSGYTSNKKRVHNVGCSKYVDWSDLGETVYDDGNVKITESYYGYDSAYKVFINGMGLVWENGHIE
jgi:hypothetical protein